MSQTYEEFCDSIEPRIIEAKITSDGHGLSLTFDREIDTRDVGGSLYPVHICSTSYAVHPAVGHIMSQKAKRLEKHGF